MVPERTLQADRVPGTGALGGRSLRARTLHAGMTLSTRGWPAVRELFAVAIGLVAALSATDPLNTINARLDVGARPWLSLLTPSCLVAIGAVVAAMLSPRQERSRIPATILGGGSLLVLAAIVSTVASPHPAHSTALLLTCVLAPAVTLLAVWGSDLPRWLIAAAWLVGVVLLLLRADVVFLLKDGIPTPHTLFNAKYSNAPYDFHYYTLGNPNSTTAFLVMPLLMTVIWSQDRTLSARVRRALTLTGAFTAANMILVFTRTGIAIVVALAVVLLWNSDLRSRRLLWLGLAAALAVGLLDPTIRHYFSDVTQQSKGSSAQVRVTSIESGFHAMVDRPLTGYGLGGHGVDTGFNPAHSAVIQTGAETGVAGAVGVLIILVGVCLNALRIARRHRWSGLASAGALSAGGFAMISAVAGSTSEWLGSDTTSAWGLALGISFVAASARPETEWVSARARAVFDRLYELIHRAPASVRTGPLARRWARGDWIQTGGAAPVARAADRRLPFVWKVSIACVVFGVTLMVAFRSNLSSRLYARFPEYGPLLQRLPDRSPYPPFDSPLNDAAIHRAASIIGTHGTYLCAPLPTPVNLSCKACAPPQCSTSLRRFRWLRRVRPTGSSATKRVRPLLPGCTFGRLTPSARGSICSR